MPRHCRSLSRKTWLLALALCIAPVAGVAQPAQAQDHDTPLPASVREAMEAVDIPPEAVSILVQRRGSNEPLLSINAETPRNPASVMKLFTTYAALEALGPGHTWETRVYADGTVRDGRLDGDLRLVGDGDPHLTAEDFWSLLGAIRRQGIKHIDGDLVLDGTRFAPAERDPGAFDGRPYRAYNQPPHALLVNLNTIKFELASDRDASSVHVAMHPPLGNLPVENRLRVDPDMWCGGHRWHVNYDLEGGPETPRALLEGRYGAECATAALRRTGLPVENYVHGLFDALWAHWDGTFDGHWRADSIAGANADAIVTHESRPLAEIIRLTNKYSNNVMARQLALTIAAEAGRTPAMEVDGREGVRDALEAQGLATDGMVLDEVAGLSRDNRVSANHVAALLETAADSLVMPEFMASLPIAGVDGTLRGRLRDGPESGRVRMKTGMINDVSAIAGYMRNAHGEDLVVVVLINHDGAHLRRGSAVQDAVIRWGFRTEP